MNYNTCISPLHFGDHYAQFPYIRVIASLQHAPWTDGAATASTYAFATTEEHATACPAPAFAPRATPAPPVKTDAPREATARIASTPVCASMVPHVSTILVPACVLLGSPALIAKLVSCDKFINYGRERDRER